MIAWNMNTILCVDVCARYYLFRINEEEEKVNGKSFSTTKLWIRRAIRVKRKWAISLVCFTFDSNRSFFFIKNLFIYLHVHPTTDLIFDMFDILGDVQ